MKDRSGRNWQDEDKSGNTANGKCCVCGQCDDKGGYGEDDKGGYGGDVTGTSDCSEESCCTCGSYEGIDKNGTPNGKHFSGQVMTIVLTIVLKLIRIVEW